MSMRRQKKYADLIFLTVFCVSLLMAMFVTICKDKESYSYYENRNLSAFPRVAWAGVLSGEWETNMDTYLSEHAAGRTTLLKINTKMNMDILKQPLVNEVVITEKYLLPEIADWKEDVSSIPTKVTEMAENLLQLKNLVQSYGGTYYYVAVPCQYVCHQEDYPDYMNNRAAYTEMSVSMLSDTLGRKGVNFIDMGQIFSQLGWPDEVTSSVDNHFGIYGAYFTYLEIMEHISKDTEYQLKTLLQGDYITETLPNHYLGSRMRKLMDLWPSEEKLSVLLPVEEIPFLRYENGVAVEAKVYNRPQTSTENVTYNLYMGGDHPFTEIDTQRPELPSILIYGDSFTNAVECIIYSGFNKMYSLDMRYYDDMSLGEFIELYKPEVVVCVRDYEALLSTASNGCGP